MKKFNQMILYGQSQMEKYKIIRVNIFIFLLKNGLDKCNGGLVLLKVYLIIIFNLGHATINT